MEDTMGEYEATEAAEMTKQSVIPKPIQDEVYVEANRHLAHQKRAEIRHVNCPNARLPPTLVQD